MPTLLILLSWLAVAPVAAPAAAAGPTLAREDTMYTELPEVLVRAPRVTLDEILDRIARGERQRDSLLVDQSFLATVRIARSADSRHPAEMLSEMVMRVYRKKPDRARTLLLRRWEKEPKDKGARVHVSFRSDMSEEIVNFAFRPEARSEYRYRIEGRDLLGDHLIYRLRFEPRSPLDPTLPNGLVWVDTKDFVVVRQELNFSRSPVPILLKGVDRMVIERGRVDGHWVLQRVLLRAQGTIPLPKLGRRFDVVMRFDEYAINRGISDSVFDVDAGQQP
jgi:hypothetical protein